MVFEGRQPRLSQTVGQLKLLLDDLLPSSDPKLHESDLESLDFLLGPTG